MSDPSDDPEPGSPGAPESEGTAPPPAPVEPDPFRNARGLNAMFARREGPPLWPFLLAAVVLVAVFGIRMALASKEARERDGFASFQREIDARSEPASGSGPTLDEITGKARRVCGKLATCGGMAATDPIVDDCVRQDTALASTVEARVILGGVLDSIDAQCGAKPCEEFSKCYFEHIKTASGAITGPVAPISAGDRARIKKLICEVAHENPGHLPDLTSPAASPKARELGELVGRVGPGAASDLMSEAISECGGDTPAASSAAAH